MGPAVGGPIFIVGPMGSGTTLLRLMLDSHPHIAIPPETGFMRAYKAHRFVPFKITGRGWARRLGWSDDELDALLRDLYDTLFMRYAEQHGKRRWGEKTPVHTWHVDAMARLFPDARFVGIIRHPGAVVSSNMRRWKHSLPKAAIHYDRYARELARQAARRPKRFVVLRYEDLLLQPEPVMRELLDWLGEPWADEVLAHDEVQSSRGGRRVVEGRTVVDDPIDVSRMSKWVQRMDVERRARLDERLGRLGAFFGYRTDDPSVLEPIAGAGRYVARGDEIAARLPAFPDLNLKARPVPPVYEVLYDPRKLVVLSVERYQRLRERAAPRPPQPLWRIAGARAKRRARRLLGR